MAGHHEHQAGTVGGCQECGQLAYEPSWYASLLAFSQDGRSRIVPDAGAQVAVA